MGVDLTRLSNHSMHYFNAEELLHQIEINTDYSVCEVKEVKGRYRYPSDGFDGWLVHVEEGKTLQQHIDGKDLIEFSRRNEKLDWESFYVSPYVLRYTREDFYLGRWTAVKHLADHIREQGLPSPEHYRSHPCGWQLENRKNYFDYCKKLGTTHSVVFCDDKHQEWLDYFVEETWTFQQFIEWGKNEFLFVNFRDLTQFRFPTAKDDYYNIFIYDDFEDLKQYDVS